MSNSIAKTTFETGPNSKLAAPDIYKESTTEPTNALKTAPTAVPVTGNDKFTPPIKDKSPLSQLLTQYKDPSNSVKDMVDRFNNVVNNPKELRNVVGKEVLGTMLTHAGFKGNIEDVKGLIGSNPSTKDILGILGQTNEDLKIVVGGIETVMEGDLSTVTGVAELLQQITGNSDLIKVLDLTGKIAAFTSAIDIAMEFRIPEIIDLLIDDIKDEKEQRRVRLSSCMSAARHSDLDFIIACCNDSKIGTHAVISTFPDLVTVILENFKFTNEEEINNHAASMKLVNLIFRLKPKWLEYSRNGKKIASVQSMGKISDNAVTALSLDERTLIAANIAKAFPPTDSIKETLITRNYSGFVEGGKEEGLEYEYE